MKVFITFGQEHRHDYDYHILDKDCIAAINCDTFGAGRRMAMAALDGLFHKCYSEEELSEHILSYFPRGIIILNPRDEDEWIEWDAGDCPEHVESLVEIQFCNGDTCIGTAGKWLDTWSVTNKGPLSIHRYKLIASKS